MADAAFVLALISLVTGTLLAPFVSHILTLRRLKAELISGKELALHEAKLQYEMDARKRLLEQIGAHKSQVLSAAFDLHLRLDNLVLQVRQAWQGEPSWLSSEGHYFISFTHRMLRLNAWIELLDQSLTYIDQAIPGADEERSFLNHLRLIRVSFSDLRLFEGFQYDSRYETGHFFSDSLIAMAQAILTSDDKGRERPLSQNEFVARFDDSSLRSNVESMTEFLRDFQSPASEPLKWVRLVTINYAACRLLATFGYDYQRPEEPDSVLEGLRLAYEDDQTLRKLRTNIEDLVEMCCLTEEKT